MGNNRYASVSMMSISITSQGILGSMTRTIKEIQSVHPRYVCGCVWMCVDVCGCVWMCVDVCGCVWMNRGQKEALHGLQVYITHTFRTQKLLVHRYNRITSLYHTHFWCTDTTEIQDVTPIFSTQIQPNYKSIPHLSLVRRYNRIISLYHTYL